MKAYFVTGTGTDVGKTTVSTALLSAGAMRGLRVAGLKPVESGCEHRPGGRLLARDAQALSAVSDPGWDCQACCRYRFEAAVAPGVAAESLGVVIDFDRIRADADAMIARGPDLLLVEGAGGLLVPMGENRSISDLARVMEMPLLIVASPGLGTINHTALSVRVARGEGLEVAGFVFSHGLDRPEPLLESNAREIARAEGVRYLGTLPYLANTDQETMARAAEAGLACDELLG